MRELGADLRDRENEPLAMICTVARSAVSIDVTVPPALGFPAVVGVEPGGDSTVVAGAVVVGRFGLVVGLAPALVVVGLATSFALLSPPHAAAVRPRPAARRVAMAERRSVLRRGRGAGGGGVSHDRDVLGGSWW